MGHEYWCINGIKSVQMVTVTSKRERNEGQKKGTAFSACAWQL